MVGIGKENYGFQIIALLIDTVLPQISVIKYFMNYAEITYFCHKIMELL